MYSKDVTIRHGNVTSDGGGIRNWGTLMLENVTVKDNDTDDDGGGIFNDGDMTLTNCTVSGNSADGSGGGIFNYGTANLSNVTISDNTADEDGDNTGDGGGIYNASPGTVNFKNTILAGNTDNSPGAEAPDCSSAAGGIVTFGDNIVQNQTPCNLGGGTNDDVDPVLGPLADNGGDTQTHALLGGSPAIDAVTDCTDLGGNPVTTDQRGISRPQPAGGNCDIGAFELEQLPVPVGGVTAPASPLASSWPWMVLAAAVGLGSVVIAAALRKRSAVESLNR